jgi:hypothetical protein
MTREGAHQLRHLTGSIHVIPKAHKSGECAGGWPNPKGQTMRTLLKHVWDFVVVCVRVHHAFELLRDRFDDLK